MKPLKLKIKRGALHRQLGMSPKKKIPIETLNKLAQSENPLTRRRAIFAINFGHHK